MSLQPSAATVEPLEEAEALDGRQRVRLPRKFWVGAAIVALYALLALLAPWVAPHDPDAQDVANRLADPSWKHPVGTDELGRDVLSRLVFAARIDLTVGFLGAFLPLVVGTFLGALAGYVGRWVDVVVMRIADVVQAFPAYILIIALVFALGQGAGTILVAFTATVWVIYARIIRDEILRVRGLDYIQAARAAGLPHTRIIARHVLPNTISQTVVYFTVDILFAILALAAFTFIGLGIPPPDAEWGAMIEGGKEFLRDQWWLTAAPGIVLSVLGLGFMFMGDGLDDWISR
ncbi:MAG: ABC transporter permease [Acidimicrobiaceae bacterium]|nr:ABC transporter permease [Chloroflexota bacterium]MYB27978.1 ABC transporter permease [Acidimicrobiaceae bacterium]